MTPAESEALEIAKRVLSLNFDAFIITTRVSDDAGNDRVGSHWHGPLSDVIGMNRITGLRMDRIAIVSSDKPEI